ncbi:MAG: MCE family protein [Bdellovibrionales bacterium]|nr:MCE family protein [Bdellovibrionales bacterium]
MKKTKIEFVVGAFALAGMLLIIYMSVRVNDRGSIRPGSTQRYYAYFESVSGLVENVPVEVSGIPSGYVEEISLVNNRARVAVRMKKTVKVYEDAMILIKDRGALGDRYVVLNPGNSDLALIEDEGEIKRTMSQSDFERITATLAETAEVLKELVQSDNPQGALGQTVVNIRDITDKLDDMVGENQQKIGFMIANLESLTGHVNDIAKENKETITSLLASLEKVAGALRDDFDEGGDLAMATANLNETMESIQNITEKIERGEGTVGRLLNDDDTVDQLNGALAGLNQTFGLINRTQLKFRYRGEFLPTTGDLQNYFGAMVLPTPDKFFLIELVDAPKGETVVTDTIINSGNVSTTTQTIQTGSGLTYSVQFGKRFWDATLRVGLFRSQGGVAVDYHLLKDKLVLSVEAFDLARPGNQPIVRTYGTLTIYKHLLLTGGLNDALNEQGGIEPFFGLGLEFTDNDFKALIPAFAGSGF